ERYQFQPELKRFPDQDMVWKVVSDELGASGTGYARNFNMVRNIRKGKIGYDVPVENPIEARMFMALTIASSTWNTFVGNFGNGRENMGFLSWLPQKLPPELTAKPLPMKDSAEVTKKIKVMAAYAGADQAGVTLLDRRWVYASSTRNINDAGPPDTKPIVFQDVDQPMETDNELVIPDSVRYAVVMLFVQPRALNQLGPATVASSASAGQGYAQMGLAAVALAQAIRSLGYVAIPSMNDTGLCVPMAVDAGLGELGRLGYLITPEFGPHVRIAKVLTNLPLVPDPPIGFGVTEFCTTCGICAAECPAGAISPDRERTLAPPQSAIPCGSPGALKWYIDAKKCFRWWIRAGAGCSRCMDVCPYTTLTMGDAYNGEPPSPGAFWDLGHKAYGRRDIEY
ncbi:MAG: reductive dehalogenase, partial [Oceanisphaera sp.]|nr:reductive dehalogenase [Oceanisphaera sp.]